MWQSPEMTQRKRKEAGMEKNRECSKGGRKEREGMHVNVYTALHELCTYLHTNKYRKLHVQKVHVYKHYIHKLQAYK